MDEQTMPINPSAPAPPPKSVTPPIIIYILLAIILVTAGIIGLLIMKPRVAPVIPVPTPTPVLATPTPIRPLSNLATQSAFLQFASSVASLSTAVSGSTIQDQTLSPPVLSLPLGF